jgi:hypothetical protein
MHDINSQCWHAHDTETTAFEKYEYMRRTVIWLENDCLCSAELARKQRNNKNKVFTGWTSTGYLSLLVYPGVS